MPGLSSSEVVIILPATDLKTNQDGVPSWFVGYFAWVG
jgi:hypothetical protein